MAFMERFSAMFMQPYQLDELRFAWCYRVYLRCRTHRLRRLLPLAELNQAVLDEIGAQFDIHVLEHNTADSDVLLLLSLKPWETVSACASKIKGQISKWLRERLGLTDPSNLLGRGYFACTVGQSTSTAVEEYLSKQSEHHGYDGRARPPIFVRRYQWTQTDEDRVSAQHAYTVLQHHIVLATWRRKGVFGESSASAVADR